MTGTSRWSSVLRRGALAVAVAAATALQAPGPAFASAAGGVTLDGSPGVPQVVRATDTLYVPIQCATDFCHGGPAHVVDLLDASTCNVHDASDCSIIGRITAGVSPIFTVVRGNTMYVVNAGAVEPGRPNAGSISVVDLASCSAADASGCGSAVVATIATDGFPFAAALDPGNKTLYIADITGHVLVLSTRGCDAVHQSGCGAPIRSVDDPAGPDGIAVDPATHTVYAANSGVDDSGHTVSVIDGLHCNGNDSSGCSATPPTADAGAAPYWVSVDQTTHTVYTANSSGGNVSVIDGAHCNATDLSACDERRDVDTGAGAAALAFDRGDHTLFALNSGDNTLAAIDTSTCAADTLEQCRPVAPTQRAAPDSGPAFVGFPNATTTQLVNDTLYVVNEGGRRTLAVVDPRGCTAAETSGCRTPAPAVPDHAFLVSTDVPTHTVYISRPDKPEIDVIDGARCNANARIHCAPVAHIPVANPFFYLAAVDPRTHTMYAMDQFTDDVTVIDERACNASDTSGCADAVRASIHLSGFSGGLAVNSVTHTLYVVHGNYGPDGNKLAVLAANRCNAETTAGCRGPRTDVTVGVGAQNVAVSERTNTVYVANTGDSYDNDSVWVFDGSTCYAAVRTGCDQHGAVRTAAGPIGLALDENTHTLYIASNADGDAPGRVAVLDTRDCRGGDTSGCGAYHPSVGIGRAALTAALDPFTHTVYVAEFGSAAVHIIDGARCNAVDASGCSHAVTQRAIGSQPYGLAVDPTTRTGYATTLFGPGGLAIFGT